MYRLTLRDTLTLKVHTQLVKKSAKGQKRKGSACLYNGAGPFEKLYTKKSLCYVWIAFIERRKAIYRMGQFHHSLVWINSKFVGKRSAFNEFALSEAWFPFSAFMWHKCTYFTQVKCRSREQRLDCWHSGTANQHEQTATISLHMFWYKHSPTHKIRWKFFEITVIKLSWSILVFELWKGRFFVWCKSIAI